jgi:outer membrane protein assembly factor BamB
MSRIPLLAIPFVLMTTSLQLAAQEWPRFRGVNGSGIGRISSFPDEFTTADYDWAVKLEGIGHSSPVLWGKRLFLTIVGDDGKERRVECYDSNSGKCLWKWKAPMEQHNLHKHNNFASSTPVATADGVFVVWGSGSKTEAFALDHDGNPIWTRDWPAFSSDHGFGSSPIVAGGVLPLGT